MSTQVISAEVEPKPEKATQAAKALQKLGFRVLHIGPTISVQGEKKLWESQFGVSFTQRTKRISSKPDQEVSFPQSQTDQIPVPVELQDLIASVAFVEPPEWFGGSG